MAPLKDKKIIIAVSASIAAYKVAILTRLFVKEGAEVRIIMSPSASSFITPLTLSTLSKNPVLIDFVKDNTGLWNNHVELGLWADALLIAPATAHTMAKCVHGIADNLLIATYLSARCPVFFAPAMDLDMYQHPSTQESFRLLQAYGNHLIPAAHGELASGLSGQGRMAEPENILDFLKKYWASPKELDRKKVLITAGPTQEAIDPVRFISNHSTGKMGYALAETALEKGAEVTLVSGPTQLNLHHPNLKIIHVKSAQEMYEATSAHFEDAHITIFSAAVADYTPMHTATQKIKKKEGEDNLQIQLKRTIDIAQTLGKTKKNSQILVGFALETNNELENAKEKLKKKNFDLIVLNSLQDKGAGFGHDTNKVSILSRLGEFEEIPLKTKKEVASEIWVKVYDFMHNPENIQ